MITEQLNRTLTRVSPGTPMGELLRRYWWPIAAESELSDKRPKAVRILGEDLVLYRTLRGIYALVARRCAHRGTDLQFGMIEIDGLRCIYHGWKFAPDGACIERPFDDATQKPEVRRAKPVCIKAYRVEAKAGLLWAYLGPDPAPCLWDWEAFHTRGYKQVMLSRLPCNWLQCQENSIDPIHFEWLHENWTRYQNGDDSRAARHLRVGFEEFEFGFVYKRILEGTSESHDLWRTGRVCLWPAALYVGGFDWNVPVDDENTLRIRWTVHRLPGRRPYEQGRVPYWYADVCNSNGELETRFGVNQDLAVMTCQGRIADRTTERLGPSDRGIAMMRKQLLRDIEAVQEGRDPKGTIRDPNRNVRLRLPCSSDMLDVPTSVMPEPLAGQPPEVLAELTRVWQEHCPGSGALEAT